MQLLGTLNTRRGAYTHAPHTLQYVCEKESDRRAHLLLAEIDLVNLVCCKLYHHRAMEHFALTCNVHKHVPISENSLFTAQNHIRQLWGNPAQVFHRESTFSIGLFWQLTSTLLCSVGFFLFLWTLSCGWQLSMRFQNSKPWGARQSQDLGVWCHHYGAGSMRLASRTINSLDRL